MPKRMRTAVLAVCAALACTVIAATGAIATGGKVSPQYQAYSSTGGQDPYGNSKDPHVGGYGGSPVVIGYVKLNLESLPSGSVVEGLQLSMTPDSDPSANVNSSAAAIEACVLTQPLNSNGYQANPPPYNCNVHAAGEPQSDGSWNFELSSLAHQWSQGTNTGLALVAVAQDNTPAGNVSPSAWSIAFDSTKTTASIDYVPGQSSSTSFFAAPATAAGGAPSQSGLTLPAPAAPAPAPAVPAPAPAPAHTSPANQGGGSGVPAVTQAHVQKQWLWLTFALVGAAILMVLVGAGQNVLRTGRLDFGLALAASRSQLATPVAVLALAAVFALGSSSQLVTIVGAGRGGGGFGGTAGGTTGSGSTLAGGAAAGTAGAGGTTASGGSAAAAAAAQTNGGQDGPGVTSTTVRIGFVYVVNGQAANQAFGIKAPSTGNEQSEEQAMVDYVNKHGGLAGRKIQPVYVAYDNSKAETDPTINEEICHQMTEDYHVFAVVGGGGPPDGAAADACYAQAGTINLEPAVSGATDQTFMHQASPYLWLSEDATLDRTMTWEIAGLKSRGYFSSGPTYKLGVVVAEDPINERIYQQVTLPALQAAGVQNPREFEVPHDTISDIANTMKRAVIDFQTNQVTNVIFQGGGNYGQGSYAVLFMLDAESQQYNPRYGFSSEDAPGGLTATVPQDQFKNALAVGWIPAADSDDQHTGPFPGSSAEKLCEVIMSASGNGASARSNAAASLTFCDVMLQAQQAGAALNGQPLNAQLLGDKYMKLGSSTFTSTMVRAFYGPDHWDAAGGYKLLHAVENCESGSNGQAQACFVFDSSNVYS